MLAITVADTTDNCVKINSTTEFLTQNKNKYINQICANLYFT